MSDPNVPQGPPAGEAPPLGGWPIGSRPGSGLPARPPVATSAAPPTEAPPAWSAPTPAGDPKRPSTGALIAALAAVVAVLLLAGGLAIVLADSNNQARVEAQPRRSAPPTTSTPPPTTQPGGLGEVIGGEDPGAEPTTTQPGANEPTTTEPSTAPPATADPNTEATVDEVIAFIEKTRERSSRRDPTSSSRTTLRSRRVCWPTSTSRRRTLRTLRCSITHWACCRRMSTWPRR